MISNPQQPNAPHHLGDGFHTLDTQPPNNGNEEANTSNPHPTHKPIQEQASALRPSAEARLRALKRNSKQYSKALSLGES
jgi:hypothetical protein